MKTIINKGLKTSLMAVLSLTLPAIFVGCEEKKITCTESPHDQVFPDLAKTWDEGTPLGNATVGSLIWQKDNALRMSLDRTDLWDQRPTEFTLEDNFRFSWVQDQVLKNDYGVVQQKLDAPYNALPGPSKIPGAAIEFDQSALGKVKQSRLYLKNAVSEVIWENGAQMKSFVHATEPVGYFVFENVDSSFTPKLLPPTYGATEAAKNDNSHAGADLQRLEYKQGDITVTENSADYHQKGWGDFSYDVSVRWIRKGTTLTGVWSVTSSRIPEKASDITKKALKQGGGDLYGSHQKWWNQFWAKSAVSLPDPVLEKQYYNEIYKLGSASRADSYPISLQAV